MSQVVTGQLLALVGPARILLYGCQGTSLISALLQRGCDAWGWAIDADLPTPQLDGRITRPRGPDSPAMYDVVVVDQSVSSRAEDLTALLISLRECISRTLVLDFSNDGLPIVPGENPTRQPGNREIEEAALAAGYRRHPSSFPVVRYNRLNNPAPEALLCFEKVPDTVLERWPIEFLLANRDLHVDMLREASPRSDAHLVRYALAAEWVRPSDTVLDCACGLGYGTAMLAARSAGSSFIGVDIDPDSIAYARDNFPSYQIDFEVSSATCLDFLDDNSVDVVVSFETLEHLEDYTSFLIEVARILKPDGRIIVNVPNLWIDASGRDPNPHHHHVFDYEKCRVALARHFLVEARYVQTAPGGTKLTKAARTLQRLPLQAELQEADAEWWIVVASANPLNGAAVLFSRPEFDCCTEGTTSKVVAFDTCYDNPWLYRAWIQMGMRLSDEKTLDQAIAAALPSTAPASADRGGLLAVSAYSALRQGRIRDFDRILQNINGYLESPTNNPHVYRWCISLEFVGALLSLAMGRRTEAWRFLRSVTARDPLQFSPLIATKLVAAHFLAGTMHLVDQAEDRARESFTSGIDVARRALHAPDLDAIGNPGHPLSFGFVELAEIADMASQCAIAIDALPGFRRSPARFWRSVDSRRFGMATWLQELQDHNQNLEAEIVRLGNKVESLRSSCTIRALLPMRIKEVALTIIPGLIRRLFGGAR